MLAFRLEDMFNYEDNVKDKELKTMKDKYETEMKELKETHMDQLQQQSEKLGALRRETALLKN